MVDNPQFLTDIGINLKLAISGFWGGVCNAFAFKQSDPATSIGSVVMGVFTANYLGMTAIHYMGDWFGELGSGFIVGLGAMAICQGIVSTLKTWKFSRQGSKDA